MASSRPWPFDDDDRPSGSVQPLSQADLQAILAHLDHDPNQLLAPAPAQTGRDQRLVHMQGDRKRAVDTGNVHRGLTVEHRPCPASGDRPQNLLLRSA
jgi:hypothetical protein